MGKLKLLNILLLIGGSVFLLFNYFFELKDLFFTAMTFLFFILKHLLKLLRLMFGFFNQPITLREVTFKCKDSLLGLIAFLLREMKLSSSVFKLST
jgi:hypothetical protein